MSYHKRIVVDFDDTLAFHSNRNFDASIPNKPLIDKLNALYDQGWQIDIFTARGSLSCETREQARDKYEHGMIAWLAHNGAKYHTLSFDKPLAAYYIDDKGITPEDFVNTEIRQLPGGLSGTDIFTDGKVVHKQDTNAHYTKKWFDTAKLINTPTIHRIVGETITMDYINHDESYFDVHFYVAIGLIQEALNTMKNIQADDDLKFSLYRDRIKTHAMNSNSQYLIDVTERLNSIELTRSFSHGDFGIRNMLFADNKLYLIDPITNVFGCTELDAAKLCASLVINQYSSKQIRDAMSCMCIYNGINMDMLVILMCTEIIRVYKYHPDKNFIMECVKYVYERV